MPVTCAHDCLRSTVAGIVLLAWWACAAAAQDAAKVQITTVKIADRLLVLSDLAGTSRPSSVSRASC